MPINNLNRVISQCYLIPWCLIIDDEARKGFVNQADVLEAKLKEQAANRALLPGVIGDGNMSGEWPKIKIDDQDIYSC